MQNSSNGQNYSITKSAIEHKSLSDNAPTPPWVGALLIFLGKPASGVRLTATLAGSDVPKMPKG